MEIKNLTIHQLSEHFRNGDFTPAELVSYLLQKANDATEYNSWIHLMSLEEIQPYLDRLESSSPDSLPLYGIPFAIKDNIDLQGIPTTAACKEFSYVPDESAYVVQTLIEAGAIPLGKTNMDQFATGLVGTRSPYGETKNSFNKSYISGGSSSGSAVTVAQGLVSFALGTDTAGSGRIPAAFNSILGLKPTRGLLSTRGVVPACRTLDCVSVFATTCDDLSRLLTLLVKYDKKDAFSRSEPAKSKKGLNFDKPFIFAVPMKEQLEYFGNSDYENLFKESIEKIEKNGGIAREIDFSPFINAAKLLYQGPWVTERYLACQDVIENQPDAMLEVTRQIIAPGKTYLASDTFKAVYELSELKKVTDEMLKNYDFLLTPTAGTIYTIDETKSDPIQLNSNLGYYTNYMNLLDYAAVAIPAGILQSGLPFGVSLVSSAFTDEKLIGYANRLQQLFGLKLGATNIDLPGARPNYPDSNELMKLVVCGAHMSDLPLNGQLIEREASLIKRCKSAPRYKLIALPGGPPERPGMIRVEQGGSAIDVEVWELPVENFGSFIRGIPHPLGLGKVELEDGSWQTGFICESYIEHQSVDISRYGGWRNYIHSKEVH